MSLHTLYRPQTLEDIVGNEGVVESLKSVTSREKPPGTFLFTGPGGTGKTTIARIIAKKLGTHESDYSEQNASKERGIKEVRNMEESLKFAPLHGKKKFITLDEAHMLTKPSQEALLKILEEPPPYVHFAICTTNPEVLKPTFIRRCHQYDLEPLNDHQMMFLLKKILKLEKVSLKKFNKKVAEKILELADGSAGQALKLLDMVIDMDNTDRALKTLQAAGFGAGSPEVIDICRILVERIPGKAKWNKLKPILKDFKTDGESARRPILAYLEKVLLSSGSMEIADIMKWFTENYYDNGKSGLVLSCFLACNEE